MKRIEIDKEINTKWLTRELQVAGINVSGTGIERDEENNFISAYVEVAEADEVATLAVIEAHNPEATPDILEKADLMELSEDITNELAWIETGITDIDNGLAAVTAFTNATQRAIVTGLLQNQKRVLQQQRRKLKAWRYVVRRLR